MGNKLKNLFEEIEDREDEEERKEFVPHGSMLKSTIKLFEQIFDNAHNSASFDQYHGMLLTGDPGTGKTQRVKLLSKLLGVDIITIEAPHIIEEHIINIPFFSIDKKTEKKKANSTTVKTEGYKIELADSNLYTLLEQSGSLSDAELLHSIYSSDSRDIIELFEYFGGNDNKIPKDIENFRKNFKVILFIDEYFRQESKRIKNILRGILNNKIGMHDMPKHAYTIYATNLNDEGVTSIAANAQFESNKMKSPTKNEWFSWLVYKYEKDYHIKRSPEDEQKWKKIINEFHHILDDEDISLNDIDSEVRISPRRWEQLLLYINSSLPCKNDQDARNLLTNVKVNFKNYETGEHAELYEKVLDSVSRLIKQTSNLSVSKHDVNDDSDWRETLMHQIEQKKKLGDARTYVPVISGAPGVAKTFTAKQIAKEHNLQFIDIDCANLNAEDVIGIPLPVENEEGDGKRFQTTFSKPTLYTQIQNSIHDREKEYFDDLKRDHPDNYKELIEQYQKQPVKYLIFLDELNRNVPKVFNAIRKILLEKSFGPGGDGKELTLPKEAIMMAALNPNDDEGGAQKLSKHVQDVLDIIDVKADWKKTQEFMKTQKVPGVSQQIHDFSYYIINKFVEHFTSKDSDIPAKERPFIIDSSGQPLWMSPRVYDMFYKGLTKTLDRAIEKLKKIDFSSISEQEIQEHDHDLREAIFESFERNTNTIFHQNQIKENDEEWLQFYNDVENWVMHSDEINIGDEFFYNKAMDTTSIDKEELLGQYLEGGKDISELYNYLNNVGDSKFREDFTDFVASKLTNKQDIEKFLMEKTHPMKILDGYDIEEGSINTSLMNNFMLTIYYALEIHKQSYERIQVFLTGIAEGFKAAFKEKNDAIRKKDEDDKTEDDLYFEDVFYERIELMSNFEDLMKGNVIKPMLHSGDIHSLEKNSPEYGDYLSKVGESEFKKNFSALIADEIEDPSDCQKFFSTSSGKKHISIVNDDISDSEHHSDHLISWALARMLQVYYLMKIRKVKDSKIESFAEDMKDIISDLLDEKISSKGDSEYTKAKDEIVNIFKQFDDIRDGKKIF